MTVLIADTRVREAHDGRWGVVIDLPLLATLALQAVASLSLRNTAFQDEALYLYAGQQLMGQARGGPAVTDTYGDYFSGAPRFYPLIAGMLDSIGGLEAARGLNLLCMLGVTLGVYAMARRFFSLESARFAAAIFAVQGPVLFVGHLATCDALALALLASATLLALRAGTSRSPALALAVGGVLGMATMTKYVAFLWAPAVLALLAVWTWRRGSPRDAVACVGLAFAATVATVAAILAFDPGMLGGLEFTLLHHAVFVAAPREVIAARSAMLGGVLLLLALTGLVACRGRVALVALICTGSALIAPASHLWKAEASSLPKHLAFGLFFAAPVAGYGLARILDARPATTALVRRGAGIAVVMAILVVGLYQARGLYAEWANSDAMVQVLRTQVRTNSTRILAEESEVPRYYLQDVTAPWQWTGLYYFRYTDTTGRALSGEAAYRQAIADGYFDLVMLKYGASVTLDNAIHDGLHDGRRYELIAKLPYTTEFGPGYFWVWRKRAA